MSRGSPTRILLTMRGLATLLAVFVAAQTVAADGPVVRYVDFEANVTPVTALRIEQAVEEAEAAADELVLIRLDTAGGLLTSMNTIVKKILDSDVPVAVWVGPSGAHAASAGFFILMAADVAAMAPGTRTGAASTVFGSGKGSDDDVILKKANQDTAALVRSITSRRGRDPASAEEAVFSAKAYEETVCLERGMIDLLAGSREELVELLDGREVQRFDGTSVTLQTAGATFVISEFSLRHEFMEFLATPAVAYLLFLIGLYGIYFELSNPGMVFPGVVGALALLLFAITAQVLPVSTIGMLLIVLALVMFMLEIKVVSFGMLTLGGIVSLLVGSLMLIDGPIPELRVSWWLVVPTTVAISALCVVAVRLAVNAQRHPVGTGVEGLEGRLAAVTQTLDPDGKVFVHGEIWNASSTSGPIPIGSQVRIDRVDEMHLTVSRVADSPAERS